MPSLVVFATTCSWLFVVMGGQSDSCNKLSLQARQTFPTIVSSLIALFTILYSTIRTPELFNEQLYDDKFRALTNEENNTNEEKGEDEKQLEKLYARDVLKFHFMLMCGSIYSTMLISNFGKMFGANDNFLASWALSHSEL